MSVAVDWSTRLARPGLVAPLLLLASACLAWATADRNVPNPDEGAYLVAAAKILRGGVYYQQIDAYPFPGSSYLLALAMAIFGEHLSVARALAGGVFTTIVLGSYAAALRLVDARRAALCALSLLTLKFFAFPSFTAYLYSDLAVAFSLLAIAVFARHAFQGASWRLFGVGILVAFCVLSKQNTGIYLGLAIGALICWPVLRAGRPRANCADIWREIGALSAGGGAVLLPTAAYFAAHGALWQMIQSGLIRPFTGYLPTGGISFMPPLRWWELGSLRGAAATPYLPLHYKELIESGLLMPESPGLFWIGGELFSRLLYSSLPIAFGWIGWLWLRALRGRRSDLDSGAAISDRVWQRREVFFTIAALSLAVVASAFPRADFPHLINVAPVLVLVIFALGERAGLELAGEPGRTAVAVGNRRLTIEAAGVAVALAVTALLALRYDASLTHRLVLERAALWVRPVDAYVESVVEYVQREVPQGEPLFVYGHEAYFYFLSDRYFPWPFSQLYPGMAGGDQGRELSTLVASLRPRVLIRGIAIWPGMPRLSGYTRNLAPQLKRQYRDDTASAFAPDLAETPPEWVIRVEKLATQDPR